MSQTESQPEQAHSAPTDAPAAATPSSPLPRRRWFQFRLRTLMVFMVVVSVLLAGFAWRLQRARQQAGAVAKLRKIGVFVAYNYQFGLDSTGSVMPKNVAKSPLNERLIHLLGEDFFHDVTSVDGANFTLKSQADLDVLWATVGGFPRLLQLRVFAPEGAHQRLDAVRKTSELRVLWIRCGDNSACDLQPLNRLTELQEFTLWESPIADEALQHLSNCRRLRHLSLTGTRAGTRVSNNGVASLRSLTNLEWLDLPDAPIDDPGLNHLVTLPKLYHLAISGTKVTDNGMRNLVRLKSLSHLNVERTPVTDQGLAHIANVPSLETLNISWNPITDEGLRGAKFSTRFQSLELRETKVTDDGIQALAAYPSLKFVDVQGSMVTPAGAQQLQQSLPKCQIMFSRPRTTGTK